MSLLLKSIKLLRTAAAFMLLPLLAWSCQLVVEDYDYDCEKDNDMGNLYINVTISVSTSPITRANPTGGEYGDDVEKGVEDRETKVNNITLIFYQDANGINTTSDDAKVLCVKYYDVHPFIEGTDKPSSHTHKTGETDDVKSNEILYTTGDQKLDEALLEKGQAYKVLVVANGTVPVMVGDKIKEVREKVLSTVYTGTGVSINAADFVMVSESDATVHLNTPVPSSTDENGFVYYFECIHIERLAARIDFWTDKSNGYKTSTDNASYTTPGYEYIVKKSDDTDSNDRFVLTSITPFNLNNGNEFVFKRTNDSSNPYLANETLTNWVVDPYTLTKNGTAHPSYQVSTLDDVKATFNNAFNVTMQEQQTNKLTIGAKDDIIVGYTKENTLSPGVSPLYYYATGLAFEGYYYKNGTGTGEHCVYYYFIRHQGEKDTAHDAYTADNINDAKTKLCPSTPAMNFGIVRNNIYRISIDKVTEKAPAEPRIAIKIEEEKWRHVDNPAIYI